MALTRRHLMAGGLQGGERVIVEGVQKVRPGMPVDPQRWAAPVERGMMQEG